MSVDSAINDVHAIAGAPDSVVDRAPAQVERAVSQRSRAPRCSPSRPARS
jgi:hypothetical protein